MSRNSKEFSCIRLTCKTCFYLMLHTNSPIYPNCAYNYSKHTQIHKGLLRERKENFGRRLASFLDHHSLQAVTKHNPSSSTAEFHHSFPTHRQPLATVSEMTAVGSSWRFYFKSLKRRLRHSARLLLLGLSREAEAEAEFLCLARPGPGGARLDPRNASRPCPALWPTPSLCPRRYHPETPPRRTQTGKGAPSRPHEARGAWPPQLPPRKGADWVGIVRCLCWKRPPRER